MKKAFLLRILDILGCIAAISLISCGDHAGTPPTVIAPFTSDVRSTSATLGGILQEEGSDDVIERGVVYSLTDINDEPSFTALNVERASDTLGTLGSFDFKITGLQPGKSYSYVAYARSEEGGIDHSPTATFTTPALAGDTDSDFKPAVSGDDPFVQWTVPLADGKILVGGDFQTVGGHFHSLIARLLPDGTIDTNFVAQVTGSGITSAAVQPDGKIVIGGNFTKVNGVARRNLARLNPDGTLDPLFSIGDGPDDVVFSVAIQRDGKVLIGGLFENVNKQPRNRLARLNQFGGLEDTATFNADVNLAVFCITLQDDDQILIAGDFTQVNGTAKSYLARLNPDGSLENTATFNPGTGPNAPLYSAVVQEDGQILIGGSFNFVNGTARRCIARLNPDGSLESAATFDPGTGPGAGVGGTPFIFSLTTQVDGKILVGGTFSSFDGQPRVGVVRLNADGSLEDQASFDTGAGPAGPEPDVYSVAVQPNGAIVLGGAFFAFNNESHPFIAQLKNGEAAQSLYAPDSTSVEWIRTGSAPGVSGVTFQSSTDGGVTWVNLGNGTRITDGWELTGVALPTDGLIRARGRTTSGFGNASSGIVEQVEKISGGPAIVTTPTSTNIRDTKADLGGNVTGDGGSPVTERGVVISPTAENSNPSIEDDNVIAVPDAGTGLGVFVVNVTGLEIRTGYSFRAYAINGDGDRTSYSPVATFTTLGPPIVEAPTVTDIASDSATLGGTVVSDGGAGIVTRGIVYYQGGSANADRLASSDDVFPPVNDNGTTGTFTIDLAGLSANTTYSFAAYAENAYGTSYSAPWTFTTTGSGLVGGGNSGGSLAATLDASFAPNVNGSFVQAAAVQPDGKTIIGGRFETVGGASHDSLARLNADGTVDASFAPITDGAVFAVAVQQDGKIVIGGAFRVVNGAPRLGIARLNADGTLDSGSSFSPGAGVNGIVYSLAVQPDGKIVVGGLFSSINGQPRNNLARLNADGSVEDLMTFNIGTGPDDAVYSVALQPDNQILIAGAFENVNANALNRIARLNANGSIESITTFNPGTGADNRVFTLALQADGKILLGGDFSDFNGQARSRIARLDANGSVESTTTFDAGTGADGNVTSLAVQTDGKIILGGAFQNVNGVARNGIARLNANGSVESTTTFDAGSGANAEVDAVALQNNGQVVVGGSFTTFNAVSLNLIARINNDLATQTLTTPSSSQIQWLRGGASPEVSRVTFEVSTNGLTWTSLGAGTRITGGWEITGQTLPARGFLRARGRTSGGYLNSSSGLVEQKVAFPTTSPVKDGPVTGVNDGTFAAIGAPQPGAFAGAVKIGKAKSPAIFAPNGSVLLQVGVNGVSKLDVPNGNAVLVTLKPAGAVTAKNNSQLVIGLNAGVPVVGAQTGTPSPGLPNGVTIKKFLAYDGQGSTTFALAMLQGSPITGKNNLALIAVTGPNAVKIVASKDQDVTIGGVTQKVATLSTLVASKGTLADSRWRVDDTKFGIRVTLANKQQAIFVVPSTATTSADWTLMTQSGPIGDSIPALSGATVASFGLPGFGDTNVAQVVNLGKSGGVTAKNKVAITTANSVTGVQVLARYDFDARDAAGKVMPGVYFKGLTDPVSGAAGAVAFSGTLAGAGVDGKNKIGIWFAADGVTPKLLARAGTAAPGGGTFKEFTSLALPSDPARGPIFLGKLAPSVPDGVTAKNNVRLWAVDSTGTLQMLFRTGQNASVNGTSKEVKAFTALVPSKTSLGAASGYDNSGNIAVLATFIDGTQALIVLAVP